MNSFFAEFTKFRLQMPSSYDEFESVSGQDARDLFSDALGGDVLAGMWVTVVLGSIGASLDAARVQMDRMQKGLSDWRLGLHGASSQMHSDTHFYFICWHSIHEKIRFLKDKFPFTAPRCSYKKYRVVLERYSGARDHLEHSYDRFQGKKRNKVMEGGTSDYISGETYYYGDDCFDIGPNSLNLLVEIVESVYEELFCDAKELQKPVKEKVRQYLNALEFVRDDGRPLDSFALTTIVQTSARFFDRDGNCLDVHPNFQALLSNVSISSKGLKGQAKDR